MTKRLVAIDGNSLMHRAYYALPSTMSTPDGRPTNAIFGFLSMLIRVVEEYDPYALVVAFDKHGPTFRHGYYEPYKAGRKETPEDLRPQFPMLRDLLSRMGIAWLQADTYEADDILGTLAHSCSGEEVQSVIITGDRDALQLVSPESTVALTKKGLSEIEEYTPEHLMEVYGITPDKVPDLKGLMGDTSDNIPGIAGVGEKTALKLLQEYGSMEGVLENASRIKGKLGEKVAAGVEIAQLSKRLATIVCDAPIPLDVAAYRFEGFTSQAISALEELRLSSIIQRMKKLAPVQAEPVYEEIEEECAAQVLDDPKEAIENLTGETAVVMAEEGLYLAAEGMQYLIPIRRTLTDEGMDEVQALCGLKLLFEGGIPLVLHDAKGWITHLRQMDIQVNNLCFDTMIAEYLLEPLGRDYGIQALSRRHLGQERGDGAALLRICARQKAELRRTEMDKLYEQIELPLVWVLSEMEKEGFRVDGTILEQIGGEFAKRIDALIQRIWALGGGEFNVNSPKQLGEVLFERLGLPGGKKTKSGYSTDAATLEKLAELHEIVPLISEYRQLAKLKSTYIDALIPLVKAGNGRVRTTLNQAVTATGRISSSEPNLQNIPVRTEEGRQIRQAFVAAPGNILVDGDYSQIELRVLAHMSGDERMRKAFLSGDDIHRRTASEVFGLPFDEVTPQLRSAAKAVNFGIVYGISDFGLSQQLSIPRSVARQYIDQYLSTYAGVKQFMDNSVRQGKEQGYVTTLYGRRRPLPELKSAQYNTRSFGERVAMNAPIQGTAADIIKLAMVRVYDELKRCGMRSRLILQVHDELIVDAVSEEADEVETLLREAMEGAAQLAVPLRADISRGTSWYDSK